MANVVLVEDDKNIRELYATYLRAGGHTVFDRADTSGLIELIREVRPAIVLLDLSLPHESGVQACGRIKATPDLAQTRVVIVTAHSSFEAIRQTTLAGADGHYIKPIALRQLRSLVTDSEGDGAGRTAALRTVAGSIR